jgi:dipeptidyl aminopeptidase/acylaminoacyl peptidase
MRHVFAAFLLTLVPASVPAAGPAPSVPGPDAVVMPVDRLPIEAFLELDAFDTIKISPDGVHIAATVPKEGEMMLVFLRLSDMKQTGGVTLAGDAEVDDFVWVNPRQVVYTAREKNGSLARPRANPFLYIANADGSEGRVVNKDRFLYLIDPLRDDDDHILVGPGIRKIKLSNGQNVENMMKGYGPTHDGWVYPDNAGFGRIDIGTLGNERRSRVYARIGPHGDNRDEWTLINDGNATGVEAGMLGFSADNRTAYLEFEELEGPNAVYALDMATGKRTRVHRDTRVDPFTVLSSPVTGAPIGLVHLDGKPTLHVLDPQDRHAKELQKMARAFPEAYVFPTSFTRDGDKAIYAVSSDVNSGEFYLVDHAAGKAEYLAERQKLMLPPMMSPMRPFRFAARDGVELEGFLTLPRTHAAGRRRRWW